MKHQAKPWWKEPWPWLLMSGPLMAMIGCGITIWLAATHADPPVEEGVARHGLVIERVETGHARPAAADARRP